MCVCVSQCVCGCGVHVERLVCTCSFASWPFTAKPGSHVSLNSSVDLRECAKYAVKKLLDVITDEFHRGGDSITVGETTYTGEKNLEKLGQLVKDTFAMLTNEKNPGASRWCVGTT